MKKRRGEKEKKLFVDLVVYKGYNEIGNVKSFMKKTKNLAPGGSK
jgi:hypothetical protein